MPIHDWTRVRSNQFHDFHQSWTIAIRNALNAGRLPPSYKPLTLAAYAAGAETVAYVEPVAVGDKLPDMPVFLRADQHILCPLEATYELAWEQFPGPLKGPLIL